MNSIMYTVLVQGNPISQIYSCCYCHMGESLPPQGGNPVNDNGQYKEFLHFNFTTTNDCVNCVSVIFLSQ